MEKRLGISLKGLKAHIGAQTSNLREMWKRKWKLPLWMVRVVLVQGRLDME